MKSIRILFAVIAVLVATISSGFTFKSPARLDTTFYFANSTHANPPGTNDYQYKGTTDPGMTHCTAGVPICYGSSASGPDANGHPTGTVASVRSGNWKD